MTIVVMKDQATVKDISTVIRKVEELGYRPHLSQGNGRTMIGMVGSGIETEPALFLSMPGVEDILPVERPFKLGSREFRQEPTTVVAGDVVVGGRAIVVMAGPCSVETREQTLSSAVAVHDAGGRILRGGAFKPRTSPYSFRGLKDEGDNQVLQPS